MKLHEHIGKRTLKADVGIEIEVEGSDLVHENLDNWDYKEDGSLRGESAEYVFHRPKPIADVPACMDELNEVLKDATLNLSYRCSVHVHVNCLNMEYNQILAFLYGALLLEEPFMTYCGRERKGNRFCLRVNDAEGLLTSLDYMFGGNFDHLRGIEPDTNRYASANIDALLKFGSLEFRGMRGTTDKETIVTWANALVNLRNFCTDLGDPNAVMEYFLKSGPADFLTAALGEVAPSFRYPKFVSEMQRSFSLSIDLPNTYKRANAKSQEPVIAVPNKQVQRKGPWQGLQRELQPIRAGGFVDLGDPNMLDAEQRLAQQVQMLNDAAVVIMPPPQNMLDEFEEGYPDEDFM